MDYFKDEIYWKKNIDKKLDEDLWIDNYKEFLSNQGLCLDLGCGIGQYTKKFMEYGYDAVSADISNLVLEKVSAFNPKTKYLDMREPLPCADSTFDVVFAGLSIHYFSEEKTKELINEIKRVLKKDGLFIGSVESTKAFERMRKDAKEIEPHFYFYHDQYRRLFDLDDVKKYLSDFDILKIDEKESIRFDLKKFFIVFVAKK